MRVKVFTIIVAGLFCFAGAEAQQHCFTTEVYNKVIKAHPEVLQIQAQLEQFTKQYIAAQSGERTTAEIYTIPLVFHIIHNYGPENISDAQVLDEVRILNLDYRKLDYDTAEVIPAFKAIAADCGIQFRLANIDPNGHCTNGIDRVASTLTYNADDNSKLNDWPPDQYLNVWVVNSLSNVNAAAYAYYPGTADPSVDGVIVRYSYVGSIGTGGLTTSRTVTHEIGHCFNLEHPWGSTNQPGVACGDDGVSDTPETEGWETCNINGASCGNVVDNVQNYMEYSYCTNMFTNGQKSRMLAALNSSVAERNNLWSASNALATGINDAVPNACAPTADFMPVQSINCVDQGITFTNLSWNGQATSWSWSFPGGNPSTSTDSMPVIYYNSPGIYNATLTVSNAEGTNSVTKSSLVHIASASTNSVPYIQNFETASSFPGTDGFVLNPDNGNTWVRTTSAGSSGTASMMINNFTGNSSGQVDSYITPAVDLSSITQPVLTFKVANAQRSSTSNDMLKVYLSVDCGVTWQQKYIKSGAALATAGVVNNKFIPTSGATSTQWRQETIKLNLFAGFPNVRFKFENTSDAGNNTYVDDINITGLVGIDEFNIADLNFDIYPNPSQGESIVSFKLRKDGNVQLRVFDVMGQEVNQSVVEQLNAGLHSFNISSNNFSKGIYFVELLVDANKAVKKLVVN